MSVMKPGDTFYFFCHAYHHVIAEVVEMTGKQSAFVKDVRWIYSCGRNWTEFFRDGPKKDTVYHAFPDGPISWFNAHIWNHPIPSIGGAGK